MPNLKMTAENDNEYISVIKIDLEENGVMYFSDTIDKITLDGIDFDGKVLLYDSVSAITKDFLNATSGGGIGQVGNFSFGIARYNSYSGASNFHEDFYPATDKPLLTAKTVSIGAIWEGATTFDEITWLGDFYIEDHSYSSDYMTLTCVSKEENSVDLPPYKVQKDTDDGISYFPLAEETSLGKVLPIIYGDLYEQPNQDESYRLTPAIKISNGMRYKVACHQCHTVETAAYGFEYLSPIKTVMRLSSEGSSQTNTLKGHEIHIAPRAAPVLGKLYVIPKTYLDGGTNYENVLDDDLDTYATLAGNSTMKFKAGFGLSEEQLGQLDGTQTQCKLNIVWSSDNGSSITGQIRAFHPDYTTYPNEGYNTVFKSLSGSVLQTSSYEFGIGNVSHSTYPAKWDDTAAWTAKELDYMEFHIRNNSANTMRIYYAYFEFTDTLKYKITKASSLRGTSGDRSSGKKSILDVTTIDLIEEENIFAAAKGCFYRDWIGGRKNGLTANSLIEEPAGIVESIIRDWVHSERGLKLDDVSGDLITIDGATYNTPLRSAATNYYTDSYVINVTRNEEIKVVSNSGRELRLDIAGTGWAAGDNVYLVNVNCLINTDSFDVLQAQTVETGTVSSVSSGKLICSGKTFTSKVLKGMQVKNTTTNVFSYVKSVDSNTQLTLEDDIMGSGEEFEINGKRKGWKFAHSITSQQSSLELLNSILFDLHATMEYTDLGYTIVDLGDGNVRGTLTSPQIQEGTPLVNTQLTPLLNIYSSFTLNYGYDYTTKTYKKKITVDKNGASVSYLDAYVSNCSDAELNYKVSRKYEYSSDWIKDDNTAYYLLERLILWFSYQRLITTWTGDISNHLQYDIGDRVLIDFDFLIPTSKNNSQQFQVIGKEIHPKKKVQLTLLY